jgi:IS605 OrfB family transposase
MAVRMPAVSRFDDRLRWMHTVRLYATCAQERALVEMLRVTRELYNALLQQRRDAWTTRRVSITSKQQYAEITDLRASEPRFAAVYRECLDAALRRGDLAFAAFFRRIKAGEKPGYPRFKPARRWNQLEFPHGNRALRLNAGQRRVLAAARRLARAREREANARRDWLHKNSREIVDRYDRIVLEDLRLRSMTRSAKGTLAQPGTQVRAKAGLNRALLDAGFGLLGTLIREKAEHAARVVIKVDPRYTSQTCAACGHVSRSSRKGALFACVRCGHEADADVNAARVILQRAESPPMRAPVTARGRQHDAA